MKIQNKWLRLLASVLVGPLVLIPLVVIMLKVLMGFRATSSIEFFLPATYLATILWGGLTYVLLERWRRTQLRYYLLSYAVAAGSTVLYFLGGDFEWQIFLILFAFAIAGASVPVACWWLHYRVFDRGDTVNNL